MPFYFRVVQRWMDDAAELSSNLFNQRWIVYAMSRDGTKHDHEN
jgi:hypothetical protein